MAGPVEIGWVGDDLQVRGGLHEVVRELVRLAAYERRDRTAFFGGVVLAGLAGLVLLGAEQPSMVPWMDLFVGRSEATTVATVLMLMALGAVVTGGVWRKPTRQPARLELAARLLAEIPSVPGARGWAWVSLGARSSEALPVVRVGADGPGGTYVEAVDWVRQWDETTSTTRMERWSEVPDIRGVPIRPRRKITTTYTKHFVQHRVELTVATAGAYSGFTAAQFEGRAGFVPIHPQTARCTLAELVRRGRNDSGLGWVGMRRLRARLDEVRRLLGA